MNLASGHTEEVALLLFWDTPLPSLYGNKRGLPWMGHCRAHPPTPEQTPNECPYHPTLSSLGCSSVFGVKAITLTVRGCFDEDELAQNSPWTLTLRSHRLASRLPQSSESRWERTGTVTSVCSRTMQLRKTISFQETHWNPMKVFIKFIKEEPGHWELSERCEGWGFCLHACPHAQLGHKADASVASVSQRFMEPLTQTPDWEDTELMGSGSQSLGPSLTLWRARNERTTLVEASFPLLIFPDWRESPVPGSVTITHGPISALAVEMSL